jgi:VanZ family protein
MLFVGLEDNIPARNQVHFSQVDGALVFGERALAYSKHNLNASQINHLNQQGFEIKLNFSSVNYENKAFQFLLLLSNGNPAEQLVIAQVRDYIIVMNGDDYNYSKKTPRISIKIKDKFQGYQKFVLNVGKGGTRITLNDKYKMTKSMRLVKIPAPKKGVRVLLSGSELLKNNWRGAIKSLSIKALDSTADQQPLINFIASADSADDRKSTVSGLVIPETVTLLKHKVLDASSFRINSSNTLDDILINFFGFMPFGFLLVALMMRIPMGFSNNGYKTIFLLFVTFLCAFLFSFIIEYSQAWLVTRHSSLRDLYINTVGGVGGAIVYVITLKIKKIFTIKKH